MLEGGSDVQAAAADDAQRNEGLRAGAKIGFRSLHVAIKTLKFVTDAIYGDHLRGVGHPERPERVEVVAARLRACNVMRETLRARDASDEELLRVHSPAYLELVKRETENLHEPHELSTGDVVVGEGSLAAARRAAGGALVAMEASVAGDESVFALVRPPGHHAEPDRGMGFCLFNNAAVAARAYQAGGGRVLVVDFDYHHGNGTEAAAGKGVSYLSTHAYPAYPGTGLRSYRLGEDLVVNVPLPAAGVTTESFVATWEALLPRVAEAVRPDLIMVSAGFDYVRGDPIGDLGVDTGAARHVAAAITAAAGAYCGGRVVWVLEGGYDLDALTSSIEQIAEVDDGQMPGASGADPVAISKSAADLLAVISEIPQGGPAGTAN